MLKSHFQDAINTGEGAEVYEMMSASSEDIMMKYSGCSEDIYESMLGIDPECAEDLCKINMISSIVEGGAGDGAAKAFWFKILFPFR